MLIRSQDKEELCDITSNFGLYIDQGQPNFYKYMIITKDKCILGFYDTMEKVKQVLTDIELEILAESKIFIMPQDYEVEVMKNEI